MKEKCFSPICRFTSQVRDYFMLITGYVYILFKIRSLNRVDRQH